MTVARWTRESKKEGKWEGRRSASREKIEDGRREAKREEVGHRASSTVCKWNCISRKNN